MIIIVSNDENFYQKGREDVLKRHLLYHNLSLEKYDTFVQVILLTKNLIHLGNDFGFIKHINSKVSFIRIFLLLKYIFKQRHKIEFITMQNSGLAAFPVAAFTRIIGIKFGLQIHTYISSKSYYLFNLKNFTNFIFTLVNIMLSSRVRVVSNSVAIFLRKNFPNKKIFVVPVPVELKKSLISKVEYDLIFIGRLSKEKNPLLFIQIVQKGGYKAIMIGDGEDYNNVYDLCKNSNIKLIRSVPEIEVCDYIKKSKILVITSFFEGLSRVGIQALSVGVPVVSTDCKGVNDYIINGRNGYIITNNNILKFIDLIDYMLINSHHYKILSENSPKTVDKYSYDLLLSEVINFLNDK